MQDKGLQKQELTVDGIRQLLVAKGNKVQPSEAEVVTFLRVCQSMGANPFLGDVHLIKYSQGAPASTVTGKDYFTKTARSLGGSWKAGLIIQRGDQILEEDGEFKLKSDVLLGGWAEVKTQDGGMFKSRVSLDEYSSNQSTWNKMQNTMIRKVALVHSLREAYPERLGGVYDSSEMQQAVPQVDLLNAVEDTPTVEPPKVITTTVKEIIEEQKAEEPVLEQEKPPQTVDKSDSLMCPIHGVSSALREGQYGEYYSHQQDKYKNGWCNNSMDKPSQDHKDAWLKEIINKHGEEVGNEVVQNSEGQGILWWLARLENADLDTEWCEVCADKADEIVNGHWFCVEHVSSGS
tara:strand:- start:387 stop:1430 length:1044 start_codon:yes stop_codon:yes gene_type:complete